MQDKVEGKPAMVDKVAADMLKRGVAIAAWVSHLVIAPPLIVEEKDLDFRDRGAGWSAGDCGCGSGLKASEIATRTQLRDPGYSIGTDHCNSFYRCLMKWPLCNSVMAWRSSAWVFMTMGPYHATGSSIGCRKRAGSGCQSGPAWT